MKKKAILLNNLRRKKDKKKKVIISVIGITESAGVTHTSIMLAKYLSFKSNSKVIILELTKKRDFIKIQRLYEMAEGSEKLEKRFTINKITFLREVNENDIASVLNEDFEYFILDLGADFTRFRNECLRSDIKLVLGSLTEWKRDSVFQFFNMNEERNKVIDFIYLMLFGDEREVKHIKNKIGIQVYPMSYSPDPFTLREEVKKLFDKLI